MSSYSNPEQSKISKDGLIGTILFHLFLLLVFLIATMHGTWPIEEPQGILINFGTATEGMGEQQPIEEATAKTIAQLTEIESSESSTQASSEPDKQSPSPIVDTKVQTHTSKDTPALPTKDKKKKEDTNKNDSKKKKKDAKKETKETKEPNEKPKSKPKEVPKEKPKENANDSPKPKPEKPKEPTIDPNALFTGNKSNNAKGQGNNSTEQDIGSLMGNVDISDNTSGSNAGLGNSGIGLNLRGRNLLNDIAPKDASQDIGRVVIKIWVDRSGKVKDARFESTGSNTSSSRLKNLAITAAKKAKFNADVNAPEVQTGTLTFNFKVQ